MSVQKISLPDFGDTNEVVVIELSIKPGQFIQKDEVIAVLESEKTTFDMPSPYAGTIKEVLIKKEEHVLSNQDIATIETEESVEKRVAEDKEDKVEKNQTEKKEIKEEKIESLSVEKKSPSVDRTSSEEPVKTEKKSLEFDGQTVHAGPAVRHLANQFGINLKNIAGTGPKQRILKEDIQAFIKESLTKPTQTSQAAIDFSKFGPIEKKSLTRMQKITASNMQSSWQTIPHVTQFNEADITELDEFRQSQSKESLKLTLLAFLVKALITNLQKFPQFNASFDEKNQEIIFKNYYHIGVAVDTTEGLLVPVIKNADKKSILEIAKEIKLLSDKAKNKQLLPPDLQGATCTITSLGKWGGLGFTPIINPPEVAILAVSAASMKPVWQNNAFVPRLILPFSLSYDHRVINGADAGKFMNTFSQLLQDIRLLLM